MPPGGGGKPGNPPAGNPGGIPGGMAGIPGIPPGKPGGGKAKFGGGPGGKGGTPLGGGGAWPLGGNGGGKAPDWMSCAMREGSMPPGKGIGGCPPARGGGGGGGGTGIPPMPGRALDVPSGAALRPGKERPGGIKGRAPVFFGGSF